jgi:type III secretion HrpO family protein
MDNLFYIGNKALYIIVVLSSVPVLVASVVGVVVAIIQAITHVQEQTLPFGVKLLAVALCLYIMMSWFGGRLYMFTLESFRLAFE